MEFNVFLMMSRLTHSIIPRIIRDATNWLVASEIQSWNGDFPTRGGFRAWYDQPNKSYSYVYSEATGYLITTLVFLFTHGGDRELLGRAEAAATWLIDQMQDDNGGFRCLCSAIPSRFDYKENRIYTFDCGMILNGLTNLYRVTGHNDYLVAAKRVADWLVLSAQREEGSMFPVYLGNEGRFFEGDESWSTRSGSYHTKVAIGFLNLFELTSEPRYKNGAIKLCEYGMRLQKENGLFPSYGSDGNATNAHPHLYSAEGLWVAGMYLKQKRFLKAAARAIEWLLDLQIGNGVIPRLHLDGANTYQTRVDAIAQALRLGTLAITAGHLPKRYEAQLAKLFDLLTRFQARDGGPHSRGGFYFGYQSDGQLAPHINVWVTAFAIQSIYLYGQYLESTSKFEYFQFV